jgi:hypothetical protein
LGRFSKDRKKIGALCLVFTGIRNVLIANPTHGGSGIWKIGHGSPQSREGS